MSSESIRKKGIAAIESPELEKLVTAAKSSTGMTLEIARALFNLATENNWPFLPSLVALIVIGKAHCYQTGQQLIDQGIAVQGIEANKLYSVDDRVTPFSREVSSKKDVIIREIPSIEVCQLLAQAYLVVFEDDAKVDV